MNFAPSCTFYTNVITNAGFFLMLTLLTSNVVCWHGSLTGWTVFFNHVRGCASRCGENCFNNRLMSLRANCTKPWAAVFLIETYMLFRNKSWYHVQKSRSFINKLQQQKLMQVQCFWVNSCLSQKHPHTGNRWLKQIMKSIIFFFLDAVLLRSRDGLQDYIRRIFLSQSQILPWDLQTPSHEILIWADNLFSLA